ncbi:hypothetical protein CIB48_g11900 [Xylaria polymorpha]|nr:hypothetical protein CIB48_g11900 [Xylaria polymorpha]
MGRPPAYIFVVRHGNRLDAADKQWHLSSPTPYDPPLTYGGWMHSRNVGTRIAAILRDDIGARAPSDIPPVPSSSSSSPPPVPTRRRFRVVLHSSPFLRCVQTSIAISAGLALNPASAPTSPPASASSHDQKGGHVDKAVLRLDPFLGEWLSPEYFEHITPPPKSALMLATAKAELLRRSSYHDYPPFPPPRALEHVQPSVGQLIGP